MALRLVSETKAPPGEFFIRVIVRDGDWAPTHSVCGGEPLCKTFGPLPTVGYVAKQLLAFLRGNNLPRADIGTLVTMIHSYTCQRLGGNRKFCYDTDKSVSESSPTVLAHSGRGCCGAKL